MPRPTERDAADASEAVGAFWSALAGDDDLALLRVIDRAGRETSGTNPGVCDRLRAQLGLTADECLTIGTSSKVRVMPGGPMVFMCLKLESGEPKVLGAWGPEQVHAWALTVTLEGGFWRVSGTWHGEQWPRDTLYLDLPWAPPPERDH
jgi:hypothetical protein